jgi:hypothetical protein
VKKQPWHWNSIHQIAIDNVKTTIAKEVVLAYWIAELELLAIVETLKEFNGMLWGQRIIVYTDHKNLTRDGLGLTSDRVANKYNKKDLAKKCVILQHHITHPPDPLPPTIILCHF